ncbi:MAG TPA: endolytic transglycosylase MltG [Gemmatimonadales bacterium]|nr:endolytic transglycosylase MltG [Gemmatimonadales bacterium]
MTIPPGATLEGAVDSLAGHGVIRSPTLFRLYARIRGLRRSLKSGDYLFAEDAPWGETVTALEHGRGVETRWTVPEGLMLTEVADLAHADLGIPRDSFLIAARDSGLRRELGLPREVTTLEGYLFPTTYVIPLHPGARELVGFMVREFLTQWQPEWQARLDTLRLTRHQLVTLASIVEAEVRYDPDRPFVSAVYHNRLDRRMKLDADPTVVYAYGHRLKRVWEKNLEVRSPYNTYIHAGLPPGPIAQPGKTSLIAALYPAQVPFLYFVAQPDGKHIFSTTFAEHELAIAKVKRMQSAARARPRPGP